MKKLLLVTSILACSTALANEKPDRVGGSAKADFHTNELSIPCVQVAGLSGATEGLYFDIILKRQGKSYNYELVAAAVEDSTLCERIADFAEFEDDDFISEDEHENEDLDDEESDSTTDKPDLLAQCEARPARSRVSVKAKDLASGEYYARITSGDNVSESMLQTTSEDEVEFDFDSNADDIEEGAEAIDLDFIVDGHVNAEIYLQGTAEPLLALEVACAIKS